ncbi:MAG: glycine cleavage system aminomethyltransferase GcvT [Lachnospiraceae bacterium]|jgi:aminomethyltransferase|nr:glycine cleavage system aminomethyltransferase GcvT [Lachnospiraceae bacterium]
MDKKTPLYETHVAAGGKIVPFAGWLLPVQYGTGVIAEHMAVRRACGLFDVSHMGELTLKGPDATANLNRILTNDYTKMDDGRARYSPMCNGQGGCVDDLIVYKKGDNDYFIVVNAANTDKDFAWFLAHLQGDAVCENVSEQYGQIALQGPKAADILARIADASTFPKKYYTAVFDGIVAGIPCIISRTGYTGEFGYEFYCAAGDAVALWDALLKAGKGDGLIPCGLGARDTLRLEAAMPLYGHEMDDTVSPLETGLDFAVKLEKPDFIGKAAMTSVLPPARERVGLRVTGRGIAREEQDVILNGEKIGHTTSGTFAPFLGYPVAMALVRKGAVKTGGKVTVSIRGREVEAEVTELPFYKAARH